MIRADFGPFKTALYRELSEKLPLHTNNPANYGFALGVEDDVGYCGMMYTIGNEDRLKELGDEDLRYAPVEWEPDWLGLNDSSDVLVRIYEDYFAKWEHLQDEQVMDSSNGQYLNDFLLTAKDVLKQLNSEGAFGPIWFKTLSMSDGIHPILFEALKELNDPQVATEAAKYLE